MQEAPKKTRTYSEPEDLSDPYKIDKMEQFYTAKYEDLLQQTGTGSNSIAAK